MRTPDTRKAASALAKRRWSRLTKVERSAIMRPIAALGGRPKKLVTCARCGKSGGTVEMRGHRCGE